MGYFLMVKTAEPIQIKYLCKCIDSKDPMSYTGSGVKWRKLVKKYNCTISTEVLGWYATKEELKRAGLFYSDLWGVATSPIWANYIPEIGDGGPTVRGKVRAYNLENTKEERFYDSVEDIPEGWKRGRIGTKKTPEYIEWNRQRHLGKKRSETTRQRMRNAVRKKRLTIECETCRRCITKQNFKRHDCTRKTP